ncbi:MAG: hypothetical protein LAT63_00130 [Marinobacter sp.]|nr:hypothetical protein [Marinobacter sp.]
MLQESFKNGLNSVTEARTRLEKQVKPQLDWATTELKKVLKDMGADVTEPRPLNAVVNEIRSKNPSLKALLTRFDVATYDVRKKLWWDANMMGAYVADQAGKRFNAEVLPKVQQVREQAEARVRQLVEQVRGLTARAADTKPADEA